MFVSGCPRNKIYTLWVSRLSLDETVDFIVYHSYNISVLNLDLAS